MEAGYIAIIAALCGSVLLLAVFFAVWACKRRASNPSKSTSEEPTVNGTSKASAGMRRRSSKDKDLEEVVSDNEFVRISVENGIVRNQSWHAAREEQKSGRSQEVHWSQTAEQEEASFMATDMIDHHLNPGLPSGEAKVINNPLFGMDEDEVQAAQAGSPYDTNERPASQNVDDVPLAQTSDVFAQLSAMAGGDDAKQADAQPDSDFVPEYGDSYPGEPSVRRLAKFVKDWSLAARNYSPPDYTAPSVAAAPVWADPDNPRGLRFNAVDHTKDGKAIDRTSFEGFYTVSPKSGRPCNPKGRTGIAGRGLLGRWGPNQAADPIVTRWAFDKAGDPVYRGGHRVLEVACITRRDNGMLALPGGFVDPGEKISLALKREFGEEALSTLQMSESEREEVKRSLDTLFERKNGKEVYRGYVDDPRNTDNAWIETVAVHYHDNDGSALGHFNLKGGDDATSARWTPITKNLQLYVQHAKWVEMAARRLNAFWDQEDNVDMPPSSVKSNRVSFGVSNLVYAPPAPGDAPDTSGTNPLVTGEGEATDATEGRHELSHFESFSAENLPSGMPSMATLKRRFAKKTETLAEEAPTAEADGETSPTAAKADDVADASARTTPISIIKVRPIESVKEQLEQFVTNNFKAKYYGSVGVQSHEGDDAVDFAVKAINPKKAAKEASDVILSISLDGIRVERKGKRPHISQLKDVSYGTAHSKHKDLFCFIATEKVAGGGGRQLLCHVLQVTDRDATEVEKSLGQAFDEAKAQRTDPFAVDRETTDTSFAVEGFQDVHIDRAKLKADMILGKGQYGRVFLAHKDGEDVAIKLMSNFSKDNAGEFLSEAAMMLELEHPRSLPCLGLCLDKTPWLLVVPFMAYKDLGVVLRRARKTNILLRPHEQLTFMVQAIEGLEFIASRRIVHRDIAARNVLLDHNNQVRIGDFGLARHIPEDQDFWRLDRAGNLPVRYMAIESLTLKRFYVASDIWAFGVFMWEVISYGLIPWESEGVPPPEVRKQVLAGRRLKKPDFLPPDENASDAETDRDGQAFDRIYDIANSCWMEEIEERPTPAQLRQTLESFFKEQEAVQPAARDIGKLVFEAIEGKRASEVARADRGGAAVS